MAYWDVALISSQSFNAWLRSTRSHVVFTIYVESRSRVESSEKVALWIALCEGCRMLLLWHLKHLCLQVSRVTRWPTVHRRWFSQSCIWWILRGANVSRSLLALKGFAVRCRQKAVKQPVGTSINSRTGSDGVMLKEAGTVVRAWRFVRKKGGGVFFCLSKSHN